MDILKSLGLKDKDQKQQGDKPVSQDQNKQIPMLMAGAAAPAVDKIKIRKRNKASHAHT
jgi:hypothetical protein